MQSYNNHVTFYWTPWLGYCLIGQYLHDQDAPAKTTATVIRPICCWTTWLVCPEKSYKTLRSDKLGGLQFRCHIARLRENDNIFDCSFQNRWIHGNFGPKSAQPLDVSEVIDDARNQSSANYDIIRRRRIILPTNHSLRRSSRNLQRKGTIIPSWN